MCIYVAMMMPKKHTTRYMRMMYATHVIYAAANELDICGLVYWHHIYAIMCVRIH